MPFDPPGRSRVNKLETNSQAEEASISEKSANTTSSC